MNEPVTKKCGTSSLRKLVRDLGYGEKASETGEVYCNSPSACVYYVSSVILVYKRVINVNKWVDANDCL